MIGRIFPNVLEYGNDMVVAFKETVIMVIIAGAIGLIIGIIAMFWDKIEDFLTKLQDKIYNVGDKIMDWITNHTGVFRVLLGTIVGTIIGVVTDSIEFIKAQMIIIIFIT